jgi:hypothetical protein
LGKKIPKKKNIRTVASKSTQYGKFDGEFGLGPQGAFLLQKETEC